jgi:hypothetical protein
MNGAACQAVICNEACPDGATVLSTLPKRVPLTAPSRRALSEAPPSHIEEPHPALLFQAVGWSKQKEVQPDVEGTNLGADAFFNNTRNFHSLDPNVSEECGLSSSL